MKLMGARLHKEFQKGSVGYFQEKRSWRRGWMTPSLNKGGHQQETAFTTAASFFHSVEVAPQTNCHVTRHCQIIPLSLYHATWHSYRECLESSMSHCQIDSLKELHIHTNCWLGSPTYIYQLSVHHSDPSAQCGGVGTTFCITVSIGSTAATEDCTANLQAWHPTQCTRLY